MIFSACGKLDPKTPKAEMTFEDTKKAQANQVIAAQAFTESCKSEGGILEDNGKYCVTTTYTHILGKDKLETSNTTTFTLELTQIADGAAVQALGPNPGNAVELTLDDKLVSAIPSANNRPVTTTGGNLALRLRPGSFEDEIRIYVYTCKDQFNQVTRCPY